MTGLAANSKSGPNVKLEDNAEQLPSAYIDKEKLPEKPGAEAVVVALAGAAAVVPGAGAVVVALAGAAAVVPGVGAAVVPGGGAAVVVPRGGAAVVGVGLEEQTALKERPEPSGSGSHWPLGYSIGWGEPCWLH